MRAVGDVRPDADGDRARPRWHAVVVTRVEWTLLGGEEVEAVVAMFVNREHVDSVRITPSKGDGGVDILDRMAGPRDGDAVYQVKRYTEALSAKQKAEVEKSLRALARDPRWSGLNVTVWYLVTPWNPTPEAEAWLQGSRVDTTSRRSGTGWTMLSSSLRSTRMSSTTIHGGRDRIAEAYKAVAAAFGAGRAEEGVAVPGVVERIERALPLLDRDPHYRYELRFGEGPFPEAPSRPNLVMTWLAGDINGGRWTAVDIIARCAASVEERPITVTGHFTAESTGAFEVAYRDFISFGTPFTTPEGSYQVEVDAPGGLGGCIDRATIATLSVPGDVGDNPRLHLEVLAPDGTVLAAADVEPQGAQPGGGRAEGGARGGEPGVHDGGPLQPDRHDLQPLLRLGSFAGQPVTQVRPALEFIRRCRPPNIGRTSLRHTPPELGTTGPDPGTGVVRRDTADTVQRVRCRRRARDPPEAHADPHPRAHFTAIRRGRSRVGRLRRKSSAGRTSS